MSNTLNGMRIVPESSRFPHRMCQRSCSGYVTTRPRSIYGLSNSSASVCSDFLAGILVISLGSYSGFGITIIGWGAASACLVSIACNNAFLSFLKMSATPNDWAIVRKSVIDFLDQSYAKDRARVVSCTTLTANNKRH